MEVQKYLSRYHYMTVKLEKLQDLYDEYIRMSHSIPGVQFDQIRVSGTRNLEAPFVKWIHKAMGVDFDIENLKKDLPIVKGEILSVISELEDPELERLLIYKYIDWMTWRQIADKMYCSQATIRRWHEEAVELIKIPD